MTRIATAGVRGIRVVEVSLDDGESWVHKGTHPSPPNHPFLLKKKTSPTATTPISTSANG